VDEEEGRKIFEESCERVWAVWAISVLNRRELRSWRLDEWDERINELVSGFGAFLRRIEPQ
jgi:hypothetical protein